MALRTQHTNSFHFILSTSFFLFFLFFPVVTFPSFRILPWSRRFLCKSFWTLTLENGNGFLDCWYMPLDQQVKIAFEKVKAMPTLKEGCDVVGVSQVRNFIAIGGPNAGVSSDPPCSFETAMWGDANKLAGSGVYSSYVQDHLAPSSYTRIPTAIPAYLAGCKFLPKLNNEIPHHDSRGYKQRFSSLQNLILVMFQLDFIVTPRESSLFGYYEDGSTTKILPMNQRRLSTEDLFGLKTLDEEGKIKMASVPGNMLKLLLIF